MVENGWEAGIRTPIDGSRVRRPTVRRPPNRERTISESGIIKFSKLIVKKKFTKKNSII